MSGTTVACRHDGLIRPSAPTPAFFETPEMVAEVVDNLSGNDLRLCMSVSRTFRAAAISRVHRHVDLPLASTAPNRGDIERYARTVELEHHDHRGCAHNTSPPVFKRLDTLILHRDVVEDHPGQGPAKDNYGVPLDFGRYSCGEANCVSARLVPKRLAVRPFSTPTKYNSVFFVPPASYDTIIHLRRQGPYRYRRDMSGCSYARNITIVLLPSFLGQFKSSMLASESESGSKNLENDSLIRDCLAPYILANPQNRITIVGLEDANPFASQLHWSERRTRAVEEERAFRDYLNCLMGGAYLHSDGTRGPVWESEKKAQRQRSIVIQTTREHFESNAWGDEMSRSVVGIWLNAYYAREKEDSELTPLNTNITHKPTIISPSESPSRRSRATPRAGARPSNAVTTMSIMADIAHKAQTLLPARVWLDGCVA